jgi:hypothetical protein
MKVINRKIPTFLLIRNYSEPLLIVLGTSAWKDPVSQWGSRVYSVVRDSSACWNISDTGFSNESESQEVLAL